ncbi:MAG: S8 family serine peptidase [Prevotellaceae bacterium]|jgi:subtilisin family serine protease|nr:S8 family serine peptidase [Prevotellaceae bacterium]
MKKSIIFIFSTIFFIPVFGQNNAKLSPFTRAILSVQKDTVLRQKSALKSLLKNENGNEQVGVFIEFYENADFQVLDNLGIEINSVAGNIVTAKVPVSQIENIAALPEVKRIEAGVPAKLKMDLARIEGRVDSVHNGLSLPMSYRGKGVVMGVVDVGFEYGHINFYDKSGTDLRVKKVWNQTKNKKYTTKKAILDAVSDVTHETHATHVAGIAAGAYKSDNANFYGVAPEADLVFVSVRYSQDWTNMEIFDGIKYVFDHADSVKKPAVVNVSMGSHIGPHDGTSVFDRACDNIVGEGHIFVGAAGNEGISPIHISKKFESENDTLKSFFGIPSYINNGYFYADFWGEPNKSYKIQFVEYNNTNVIKSSNIINVNTEGEFSANFSTSQIYVYTQKYTENNRANAFVIVDLQEFSSNSAIGIKIFSAENCEVNGWCGEFGFASKGLAGWVSGNGNSTMGEIGGTGKRTISVGAYNSKNRWTNLDGDTYPTGESIGTLASFSSRGLTPDGRTKPDVAAPGQILISSYQSTNSIINSYKQFLTVKENVNGKTYYFGSMQGTSMASPFAAGVIALWLQMKPDLTPEQIREVIAKTSRKDSNTGNISADGSNLWGFGKINAVAGLRYIKEYFDGTIITPIVAKNDRPYFVNDISNAEISKNGEIMVYFPIDAKDITVRIFTIDGKIILEKKLPNAFEYDSRTFYLNLPKGLYCGLIYYTNNNGEYKISGDKIRF